MNALVAQGLGSDHGDFDLEARDRVGGRAWNDDLGGGRVSERGAGSARAPLSGRAR